jgi:hypothetical protein
LKSLGLEEFVALHQRVQKRKEPLTDRVTVRADRLEIAYKCFPQNSRFMSSVVMFMATS